MGYYENIIIHSVNARSLDYADHFIISLGRDSGLDEIIHSQGFTKSLKKLRAVKLINGDIEDNIKHHKEFPWICEVLGAFFGKKPDSLREFAFRLVVHLLSTKLSFVYVQSPASNDKFMKMPVLRDKLYSICCSFVEDYTGVYAEDLFETCEEYAKLMTSGQS